MAEVPGAEHWFISVVSGRRKGAVAAIARGLFSVAEPVYTAGIHGRNFLYTRRLLKAAHARRPVVSVGNLTTGGTGKTPVVAWLVQQLRGAGRSPAVLLRGYRSAGGASDEELLLRELIAPSPVKAGEDRFAASERVLAEHPQTDVFVLDDGLQHRQLARYFSIVLIDATLPFGFGHVLPRGLLREPMRGLRRASAVLITRADLVDSAAVEAIEQRVRAEQPDVPLFRCDLKQDRLIDEGGQTQSIDALRGRRVFAFCGIGNPDAFFKQFEASGGPLVGNRRFADHHPYVIGEVENLLSAARVIGADIAITTEKDWTKIGPLVKQLPDHLPIMRAGISVAIHNDGGKELVRLVIEGIRQGDELLGWKGAEPTHV
jgi:tetraacyldisaccharide 4'-kinase